MKKQPKVTAITKQNLVNTFWDLYQEKRIEKITVREITSKAGYNRSTFYEYFTDVYDVLNYVEESVLNYVEDNLLKNLDFLNNEEVIERITNMYIEKGEYLSILLSENGDPFFSKKFKNKLKPIMYDLLPIRKTDVYSEYIFEYVMSATIGTITYWYQGKKEISLNEVITLIRSIHSKGALYEIQKHFD